MTTGIRISAKYHGRLYSVLGSPTTAFLALFSREVYGKTAQVLR
jgi:hypothetical protein